MEAKSGNIHTAPLPTFDNIIPRGKGHMIQKGVGELDLTLSNNHCDAEYTKR